MTAPHALVAILPCNNLDASEAFYAQLGFQCTARYESYRILSDAQGASLHLTSSVEDWLVPGRNPFGLYFYMENVDELAASLGPLVSRAPEHKPWGTYEFAISDPDNTLVRIGRLSPQPVSV